VFRFGFGFTDWKREARTTNRETNMNVNTK